MLAFSPLRLRYLAPYTRARPRRHRELRRRRGDRARGAQRGRVPHPCERDDLGGRARARSRRGDRGDGFPRARCRDLPTLGVATVNDGRMPAQTPYWESVSVPGIYFAGNVTQASPGLRKHGATSSSGSVNGFRYNARVLARHIAEKHFGLAARAALAQTATRSCRICSASSRMRPSSGRRRGTSRGWSTSTGPTGFATRGSCRSPTSWIATTATPVQLRSSTTPTGRSSRSCTSGGGGHLVEHQLPPHPLHRFGTDEHRQQLAACLAPLLSRKASASRV